MSPKLDLSSHIHPKRERILIMTTYASAPLYEIEKMLQGEKIIGVEEDNGALLITAESWEDENGVTQCDTLIVLPFIDNDGKAQLRVEYHNNPEPTNGNNGVVGE